MATTSTNKQPLLVDRLLHYVVSTSTSFNDGIDPSGNNAATLLVDSTTADGAIIEDVYLISRSASEYTVNLYVSPARDYLRPNEGVFVGQFKSPTTAGGVLHWEDMPRSLTPVPQVGDNPYNKAFYLPKGLALWAARNGSTTNVADAPLVGCQGGWY